MAKLANSIQRRFHTYGKVSVAFPIDTWCDLASQILSFSIYESGLRRQFLTDQFIFLQKCPMLIKDVLNDILILTAPRSVCTESCFPGFRKVLLKDQKKCCYGCVPCPEGEITVTFDMDNCMRCSQDQWSNPRRDECVPRQIEFLSYHDRLGLVLVVLAASLSAVTVFVIGIFIKHKDSPIIKANNQNLSFILLITLILSFYCPFLFIGKPTKMSCLLRQVTFGNVFTAAISSVLAKSVIVVLAFNATKPGRNMRHFLGKNVSIYLVLMCSCGEVLISAVWLIYFPPFQEYNTEVEVTKIILQCNEGSVVAFYFGIGYIGLLAFLSFVVAFLARKLPDTYNEAQNITFSMLVFCSVWVTFIPAYLSTKGKYMVAVEVFAILASGAGLLFCIFIPKCYIILIRPELNVKVSMVLGRQRNK
ncbi:vomeronasal type-2 receptor 26-like [Bombina bombina]|uniref:vomeronasal type-2 receptor 26-like n=1 Tax=Bombina bombina TaxID=8345 RepID=UPI00235AB4D4|nr:vomeronasal type-2 receptor 26-like [Bombina bombina]